MVAMLLCQFTNRFAVVVATVVAFLREIDLGANRKGARKPRRTMSLGTNENSSEFSYRMVSNFRFLASGGRRSIIEALCVNHTLAIYSQLHRQDGRFLMHKLTHSQHKKAQGPELHTLSIARTRASCRKKTSLSCGSTPCLLWRLHLH